MTKFAAPPVRTEFLRKDIAVPAWPWLRWFQTVTNFMSAPQIERFTPASSTDKGMIDTITYDNNFLYICVATNTWKRVGLSTF